MSHQSCNYVIHIPVMQILIFQKRTRGAHQNGTLVLVSKSSDGDSKPPIKLLLANTLCLLHTLLCVDSNLFKRAIKKTTNVAREERVVRRVCRVRVLLTFVLFSESFGRRFETFPPVFNRYHVSKQTFLYIFSRHLLCPSDSNLSITH